MWQVLLLTVLITGIVSIEIKVRKKTTIPLIKYNSCITNHELLRKFKDLNREIKEILQKEAS